MKLIASLAPARAEIEAGVVAKVDQHWKLQIRARTDQLWLKIRSRWESLHGIGLHKHQQ